MPLSVYNTDAGAKTARGGRKSNQAYRQREHLTEDEIVRLMEAAGDNRYDEPCPIEEGFDKSEPGEA
jgi:hypothetical protein